MGGWMMAGEWLPVWWMDVWMGQWADGQGKRGWRDSSSLEVSTRRELSILENWTPGPAAGCPKGRWTVLPSSHSSSNTVSMSGKIKPPTSPKFTAALHPCGQGSTCTSLHCPS